MQTTLNTIKPIVGIHDKTQTLVALGKDKNTLNKISSLYSDVRANPIKDDRKTR